MNTLRKANPSFAKRNGGAHWLRPSTPVVPHLLQCSQWRTPWTKGTPIGRRDAVSWEGEGAPISRPKEFFWVKLLAATPVFSPGGAGDHVIGATGGEGLARARARRNRMARPMAGCLRHESLEGDGLSCRIVPQWDK